MKRARYRGREVRQRNDERKERGLMRKLRKSEVAGKYSRVWLFQDGGSGCGDGSGILVRDRGYTPMDMKGAVGTQMLGGSAGWQCRKFAVVLLDSLSRFRLLPASYLKDRREFPRWLYYQ